MAISVTSMLKRSDAAFRKKEEWDALHRRAYKLALPQRTLPGEEDNTPDHVIDPNVFDSTLRHATTQFVGRVQRDLMPPEQQWAAITATNHVRKRGRDPLDLNKRLAEVNEELFSHIHQSEFDTALTESLLDMSVSKGVLQIMPGDDNQRVHCSAIKASHVAIDEGPFRSVDGVFRKLKIAPRNIKREWPKANLSERIQELIDQESDVEVELHEMSVFDKKEGAEPWLLRVVHREGASPGEEHVLVEERFEENPRVVFRWFKECGQAEGFGPVILALDDAMTLNRAKEVTLQNALMMIAGMIISGEDNIINFDTLEIGPGSLIEVADTDAIRHIPWQSRLDIANIIMQDLVQSIRTIMLVNSLPPADPKSTGRSFEELVLRRLEFIQDAGPPVQRLKSELAGPVIRRYVSILRRKGQLQSLDRLAEELDLDRFTIDGLFLKVQVSSPLAQADKTRQLDAYLQWDRILQTFPDELRLLVQNLDQLPAKIADWVGADPTLIRDSKDIKEKTDAFLQAVEIQIGAQATQALQSVATQGRA